MFSKCFGAVILTIAMAAAPALADDGGGGGGRDIKIRDQPQESPPAQSPPPEPAPPSESILDSIDDGWTCSAPKGAGSGGSAPAPLSDFYKGAIGHLDANIARYKQLLADKAKEIEGLDHKLAADFTADHTNDKTHDDTIKSADAALQSVPNPKLRGLVAGPLTFEEAGKADPELVKAINAIRQLRSAASILKRLEEARAFVKAEAGGCGVVID
ncbi:MAG: hypothetical protein ACKVOI_14720 [Dongiaceae bacterium]